MPFIKVKTSCPISKEQEITLKSRMGKVIGLIPGKSEEYLLLEFEDNSRLWLRGENTEPIAYIEAAIFGNESHAGYPDFTARIAEIFRDALGIAAENLYIKFEYITAWSVGGQYTAWSVGGQYIDRRMFR